MCKALWVVPFSDMGNKNLQNYYENHTWIVLQLLERLKHTFKKQDLFICLLVYFLFNLEGLFFSQNPRHEVTYLSGNITLTTFHGLSSEMFSMWEDSLGMGLRSTVPFSLYFLILPFSVSSFYAASCFWPSVICNIMR